MKVSELGEFGLIARLAEALASGDSELAGRLAVGIGDDAAVWRANGSATIATTDTLVEGVHFLPGQAPWRAVGWKALAVNVSDVAAMGGEPEFALVTLALPPDAQTEDLDELYAGLVEAADAYGAVIAGGDIVRSTIFSITVALTGRAELDEQGEPRVLRRDRAEAGDVVAVTGVLGGAAGALRLPAGAAESPAAVLLRERQARPRPRLEAGRAAVAAGLRCAIDVSDGLLQDLGHVCRASRLGGVVWSDKVPVDPALGELLGGQDALRLAATGGEDYELILIGDQHRVEQLAAQAGVPVTVIGEMVIDAENRASLLDEAGRQIDVGGAGWDHLREQP